MSRKTSNDDGSLELLLDTICNTFGGIVFISLLVVVLLSKTSKTTQESPPNPTTELELVEAEIEREQVTEQLKRLTQAVGQQADVTGTLVSKEVLRLAKSVKEKEAKHSQLVIDKSETVGEVSHAQKEINDLTKQAKNRKDQIKEKQGQAEALERKLKETVAKRSKTAVIPKVMKARTSAKTFFLKGGKLYGPRYLHGGSNNTSDFTISDRGGKRYVEENTSGGVKVDASGKNSGQVKSKFSGISVKNFHVRIFVWPESFEHFEAVRDVFESIDMKYDLVPCNKDTVIIIGGSASRGSVQ